MRQKPFQYTELSEGDKLQSAILNHLQIASINNQLCELAYAKLSHEYDPDNPQKWMQKQATIRGQMDALQYLLDCHEAAQNFLNTPVDQS